MVVDLGPTAPLPGNEGRTPTRALVGRVEEAWQAPKRTRTSLGRHSLWVVSSRSCNRRLLRRRCSHWRCQRHREVASLRFHWLPTMILPNITWTPSCFHSLGSRSSRNNASIAGVVGDCRYRRLHQTLSSLSTGTRTRHRYPYARRATRPPTLPISSEIGFLHTKRQTRIFFPSSRALIRHRYRLPLHPRRTTTLAVDKC